MKVQSNRINNLKQKSLKQRIELIDGLIEHLNLFGTIQVGYIYSNYHKGNDTSNFNNKITSFL